MAISSCECQLLALGPFRLRACQGLEEPVWDSLGLQTEGCLLRRVHDAFLEVWEAPGGLSIPKLQAYRPSPSHPGLPEEAFATLMVELWADFTTAELQNTCTVQHRMVFGITSWLRAHLTPCSHPPPRRTRRHTGGARRVGGLMLAAARMPLRKLINLLATCLQRPPSPPSGGFR